MPAANTRHLLVRAGVALRPPDRIETDGVATVVGRQGLLLLTRLTRRPIRVRSAKLLLWNDPDAPDNRLKAVVHRLNVKLRAAGCATRVATDHGVVILI